MNKDNLSSQPTQPPEYQWAFINILLNGYEYYMIDFAIIEY